MINKMPLLTFTPIRALYRVSTQKFKMVRVSCYMGYKKCHLFIPTSFSEIE